MHDVTERPHKDTRTRGCVCVQLIGARRETAGRNQSPISGEWDNQTSRVHGETNTATTGTASFLL